MFSIALLCCWSLSASAADAWCSTRGKPALTFTWLPKTQAERSLGSVQVKDALGKVVQVLEKLEIYRPGSESLQTRRDFNNDGCPDLVFTSSVAAIGNEIITAFLYNPRTRRFDMSKELSELGGLDLDPQDKNCVTGSWKGGAQDMAFTRYCWNKGKLVLKYEYSVTPLYNRDDGEFACYQHIETHYRDGKKRERKDCTKEF